MKNSIINGFKSKIKINIKGKNIERFIRRLIKNNIEIISLEKIKYNEINIIVYTKDAEKIEELKTIYEVETIRVYGLIKIKNKIFQNKYIFIFIIIGILMIYGLSNVVFNVEVIHSNKEIRTLLTKELQKYGIDKYKFKKNYREREKIKQQILNKYHDKLEWIEIEEQGTKYIVKVEERILNKDKNWLKNRDLVARKNGIIISVEASNGEIIKNKNDYVSKGDVIISGNLKLNEETKQQVPAIGKVYAETWYTVNVRFPFHYKKETKTGKHKTVYTIRFINKYYDLLNVHKYKTKQVNNKVIIHNNIVPISFIKQQQFETNKIDKYYNKQEIVKQAVAKGEKTLLKKLKNSQILHYRIIDKKYNDNGIKLKIFFAVKEDITDYQLIELPIETEIDK